jgi:hypothetical protein
MPHVSGRDLALAGSVWLAATSILTVQFALWLGTSRFLAIFAWVSLHTGTWLAIGLALLAAAERAGNASRRSLLLLHGAGALLASALQPALQYAGMTMLARLAPVPPVFVDPGSLSATLPRMALDKLPAGLATYAALAVAAQLLFAQRRAAAAATRNALLESAARDAQLQALRARLHPHFLFNALHSVSALIDESPAAARSTLVRLSELLRRTLDSSAREQTRLGEELRWAEAYLAIEQARFEDRLAVAVEVEPGLLGAQVPALLLQPLLENAVKHGIAASESGGRITIRARRGARELRIEVETDLREAREAIGASGHGLGLDLTRSRLELLYGVHSALEVGGDGRRHVAAVTIPLRAEA